MVFYNPESGRVIKENGPTYKKLLKQGIKPTTEPPPPKGKGGRKGKGKRKSPLRNREKVENPESKRMITVGGRVYKELQARGYFTQTSPKKKQRKTPLPPPPKNKKKNIRRKPSPLPLPTPSPSQSPYKIPKTFSSSPKDKGKSPMSSSSPNGRKSRSGSRSPSGGADDCMICLDEVKKREMAYLCKNKQCGKGICKDCKGGMIDLRCPNCRRDFEEEEVGRLFSPNSKRRQEERMRELKRDIEREKTANDELIARQMQEQIMREMKRNPNPPPTYHQGRGRGQKKPAQKKKIIRRQ